MIHEIECDNGSLLSMAKYDDDTLYAANLSFELIKFDLKTDKSEKIMDKARDVSVYENKLYYIDLEKASKNIYTLNCCDKDGKNIQKVHDKCYIYNKVGDNVFYQPWGSSETEIYRYNLKTKEEKTILEKNSIPKHNFVYCLPYGGEDIGYLFSEVIDADTIDSYDTPGIIGCVVTDVNGENPRYIPYEMMG